MAGSELGPKSDSAPDAYDYHRLEHGSIRLVRLMRHKEEGARIQCQLFEYPLQGLGQGAHLYEALSYVWGSEEGKKPIDILESDEKGDNSPAGKICCLHVTQNLYAALLHIRDRFFDRVLWIDAICIDQKEDKEKGQQVQFMAKIYANANRVIVWLGNAASDTDRAFQALCKSAAKESLDLDDPSARQSILALTKRPWFRRIWVLQEVAAARQILIKCGPHEVDGSAFCLGLDAWKPAFDTRPDLQALVPPITYLMRHVTFWPRSTASRPGPSFSLSLRPLGQLADMYHTREATNHHDKVYALLGIASDDPVKTSADYGAPWEGVFQRLIKLSLSDQVSVGVWGVQRGVAVIRGTGCVLGKISSIRGDGARGDIQYIWITWKNAHGVFDTEGGGDGPFSLPASAKAIKEGDVICLLEKAVEPTIVRLYNDYLAIIVIQAPLAKTESERLERLRGTTVSPTGLVLVWDWEVPQYEQDRDYESFIGSQVGPTASQPVLRSGFEKAVRLWNFGVLLNVIERYEDSGNKFRKAIEMYSSALRSAGTYPNHNTVVGPDKEVLSIMGRLVNGFKGTEESVKDWAGRTPLQWAARQGHEAVVKLLLERGADIEAKDWAGRTPLWWAASQGHEAVVRLLQGQLGQTHVRDGWR
ncbi:heterokaryon incompatibility protein-domain-containing protein [Lasiosphaeris hirsuta]|uniref:Heterokaryon incompatibility protein-domain-containing protein n=1 Tax=Lasiosphaeris hirsuta TaxID=260670 RepID=A0AA39ZVV1_9PEZI|nr:heterokaryon incompatibility protein-domain-containing protein [Lasiosphaeris hirsuta]